VLAHLKARPSKPSVLLGAGAELETVFQIGSQRARNFGIEVAHSAIRGSPLNQPSQKLTDRADGSYSTRRKRKRQKDAADDNREDVELLYHDAARSLCLATSFR
jgi:hypothetical protein